MYIYNDSSEKQWRKTSAEEKTKAKKIYRLCKKSQKRCEIVQANNRIMNAIEVIYFPYDNLDGRAWYSKTDKGFEILIKPFGQLISRNKTIKQELKRIKRQLRLMQKPPMERVRAIHDYICDNVEYSFDEKARTTLWDALFRHKVICCGYSITFKALCEISGIECDCVTDKNHEWNRVRIGDNTYYLDATWDDYLGNEKYYMKPYAEFYKIHPVHTGFDENIWLK